MTTSQDLRWRSDSRIIASLLGIVTYIKKEKSYNLRDICQQGNISISIYNLIKKSTYHLYKQSILYKHRRIKYWRNLIRGVSGWLPIGIRFSAGFTKPCRGCSIRECSQSWCSFWQLNCHVCPLLRKMSVVGSWDKIRKRSVRDDH